VNSAPVTRSQLAAVSLVRATGKPVKANLLLDAGVLAARNEEY
jgi:hypothetical protein